MAKYIKEYVNYIDGILKKDRKDNYDEIIKEHLIKISFFQHERLIHLLVTLFYGVFTLMIFAFININALFVIPAILLIVMLIFYVKHYFLLENSVQYLYKQYDKLKLK